MLRVIPRQIEIKAIDTQGSGKTTLIRELANYLEQYGYEVESSNLEENNQEETILLRIKG